MARRTNIMIEVSLTSFSFEEKNILKNMDWAAKWGETSFLHHIHQLLWTSHPRRGFLGPTNLKSTPKTSAPAGLGPRRRSAQP